MTSSVTRHHGQLSSCTVFEKTNDRILRKFSDGWTDRWTERQRDEHDFIQCCPTNVKNPASDTSFSLHINSKSNKSGDVKFITAISENPEPLLQKLTPPFPIKPPPSKKNCQPPPPLPQNC